MDGPLWESNLPMALALSATMPVGEPEIGELRLVLDEFLSDAISVPVLPSSWVTPIFDAATLVRPWP